MDDCRGSRVDGRCARVDHTIPSSARYSTSDLLTPPSHTSNVVDGIKVEGIQTTLSKYLTMPSFRKICALATLLVTIVDAENETPRNLRGATYGGGALSSLGGLVYGGASTGFSALGGLSALSGLIGRGGQGYGGTITGGTTDNTGYGGLSGLGGLLPSSTSDTAVSPVSGNAGTYPGTGVAAASSVLPNAGPAPVQAADVPSTDVSMPVVSAATPQSGTDQTSGGY